MPLRYLLDENVREILWRAIQRRNVREDPPLDAVRVGDVSALPLGSSDSEILLWAKTENRILVSRDSKSLTKVLSQHLGAGHHCPGIFLVRRQVRMQPILDFIFEAANSSSPSEWRDRIEYIP
jgi:hypothetical protein